MISSGVEYPAAMVWEWKHHQSIGMDGIAKVAGEQYEVLPTTNAALGQNGARDFPKAIGLTAKVPQSYTIAGFHALLSDGPVNHP